MTKTSEYLQKFFEEKDLGIKLYEIEHNGETHFIGSDQVIELIMQAPESEKKVIADTIRMIDFKNGDIHHYLKFLAEAYIKQNY